MNPTVEALSEVALNMLIIIGSLLIIGASIVALLVALMWIGYGVTEALLWVGRRWTR